MYKIKDGILRQNDKKIFALGESYYPSFHHAKYPVPPEGDRIGEMKKDLKMMSEMGFNHVRFAAIGLTKLDENGKLIIDTPFVDAMIEEADKNNMSVSIRLQGFAVNLRDFKDVLMIDNNGTVQDTTVWLDFIQTTMCHEGILEDNVTHAKGLAAHYDKFENMVGFQIYNEPHYPGSTIFDYNPTTINAYRKWLVKYGIMTEKEAENYEPPRKRKEQSARMWALWRLFARDCLTDFLDNASKGSKMGSDLPTFTCLTSCPVSGDNVFRGVDFFGDARTMDLVGYTCYIHGIGIDYYSMGFLTDMATSAANSEDKECWCVELDSRTYIPLHIFNRNTYATIGAGVKGIVYYQWRGDYPSEATPIPNGCGLVNYDGSKTKNFENAGRMIAFVNKMSDFLVDAKRPNDGIGIFHSDYANFLCDGLENYDEIRTDILRNSYLTKYFNVYRELRQAGYTVNVVDAIALKNNKFGIKTLFLPQKHLLSAEETAIVEEFIAKGGNVYYLTTLGSNHSGDGYRHYNKEECVYNPLYRMDDLAYIMDEKPVAKVDNSLVGLQILENKDNKLFVLTNIAVEKDTVEVNVNCNCDVKKATLYSTLETRELEVKDGKIIVGEIKDGAIIVAE